MGPQHAQRFSGRGARGKNLIQVIAHCKVGRQGATRVTLMRLHGIEVTLVAPGKKGSRGAEEPALRR